MVNVAGLSLHGFRLARQRGLDALQRGALEQARIGGDEIAGLEFKHVTGDELVCGDRSHRPSRLTLARGAVIFFSAAIDFSALNSW